MKLYGLVLLCLFLLFIPTYSQAQTTVPTNSTSSEQYRQLLEKQFFKTGNSLFDQGNYTDAITYYDRALQINSTDINVLYNKALALDNLDRLGEAITYYDKVLAISPRDTDSLNNKGLVLDKLGKHDEAITYYDKVLAINPTDTDALYNKGVSLDSLGKHDQAISYYKEVLAINPGDTSALNKLNLTFNNANTKEIQGIQKIDQTSLVIVGIIISLVGVIIVLNLIAKKTRKGLTQNVLETTVPVKEEEKNARPEIQDKKPEPEKIKEDEWKGI